MFQLIIQNKSKTKITRSLGTVNEKGSIDEVVNRYPRANSTILTSE
jgi:hypothetical protein